MIKNVMAFVLTSLMLFLMTTAVFAYEDDISIVFNGEKVYTDVSPVIINGRTLVPARSVFEKAGATVFWDDALRRVTVVSKEHIINLVIDKTLASVNGTDKLLDTPPLIINGRTLVPVRFISEALGFDVQWDDKNRAVLISGSLSSDNPANTPSTDEEVPNNDKPVAINTIKPSHISGGVEIRVELSEKVTPKIMTLENPHRLVFDFYGTTLKIPNSSYTPEDSEVKEVRWGIHPDYCRIVVECHSKLNHTLTFNDSVCVIKVSEDLKNDSDENDNNEETPSKNETTLKPGKAPIASDKKLLVCIDPGHGGHDGGAVGRDEEGNTVVVEKEANLTISLKVRDLLVSSGVDVMMTREKDVALGTTQMEDLVKRASMANDKNAVLFVSIHNNAFDDPEATGSTVLYAGLGTNEDYGISGKELAKNIQTPLAKATGLKDRGIVESPGMVVLKRTAMPAVIVECAFVTCPRDQKVLTNPSKINDIAYAIYEGIMKSLEQMKE